MRFAVNVNTRQKDTEGQRIKSGVRWAHEKYVSVDCTKKGCLEIYILGVKIIEDSNYET